ncbi:MAG: hypothetical protein IGS39_24980 [Calothrix sp. C42_A2020_038]|nr:hypothetical protein [Calothrix sp. C42_A2020_038]
MALFKNKKLILSLFLLGGMGYVSAISNLEVNNFWRGELALIPLQVLALIYVAFLNRRNH